MSYILDALRKSDQQRQRGATPTLAAAAATAPADKPSRPAVNGLLAAALICAGILIGWLQSWRPGQEAPGSGPGPTAPSLARVSPAAEVVEPTPSPPQVQAAGAAAPQSPADTARPKTPPSPPQAIPAAPVVPGIPAPEQAVAAIPDKADRKASVMAQAELPASIQREIPEVTIALHVYSTDPKERRVMANGEMHREGDALAAGLKLEQITPEGMILGYRGYRFQRGVR